MTRSRRIWTSATARRSRDGSSFTSRISSLPPSCPRRSTASNRSSIAGQRVPSRLARSCSPPSGAATCRCSSSWRRPLISPRTLPTSSSPSFACCSIPSAAASAAGCGARSCWIFPSSLPRRSPLASSTSAPSASSIPRTWMKEILLLPLLLALGIGLAINNARAVLEALFNHSSEFTRTPKYGIMQQEAVMAFQPVHRPQNRAAAHRARPSRLISRWSSSMPMIRCQWGSVPFLLPFPGRLRLRRPRQHRSMAPPRPRSPTTTSPTKTHSPRDDPAYPKASDPASLTAYLPLFRHHSHTSHENDRLLNGQVLLVHSFPVCTVAPRMLSRFPVMRAVATAESPASSLAFSLRKKQLAGELDRNPPFVSVARSADRTSSKTAAIRRTVSTNWLIHLDAMDAFLANTASTARRGKPVDDYSRRESPERSAMAIRRLAPYSTIAVGTGDGPPPERACRVRDPSRSPASSWLFAASCVVADKSPMPSAVTSDIHGDAANASALLIGRNPWQLRPASACGRPH